MQPTPTPSLLAGSAPRLRAWTLVLHGSLLGGLLALGACRDHKVAAYDVPKEAAAELPATKPVQATPSTAPDMSKLPSGHPSMDGQAAQAAPLSADAMANASTPGLQTASGPGLAWTAPSTWQSKPASMMRKATYVLSSDAGTAELAVTAFPGDVGGDIANVNRWRGQVGLSQVGDAEATAAIQRSTVNGLNIGIVDLVGAGSDNPTHLIGAIVPHEGATWFFKLLGPDAVVTANKAAFLEFVKTIKPSAATP